MTDFPEGTHKRPVLGGSLDRSESGIYVSVAAVLRRPLLSVDASADHQRGLR